MADDRICVNGGIADLLGRHQRTESSAAPCVRQTAPRSGARVRLGVRSRADHCLAGIKWTLQSVQRQPAV